MSSSPFRISSCPLSAHRRAAAKKLVGSPGSVEAGGADDQRLESVGHAAADAGFRRADHDACRIVGNGGLALRRPLSLAEDPLVGDKDELAGAGPGRAVEDVEHEVQLFPLDRAVFPPVLALGREKEQDGVESSRRDVPRGFFFPGSQLDMADTASPAPGVFREADESHFVAALRQPSGDAPYGPGQNAGQQ